MNIPRFILAGTGSDVGKTTVTIALLAYFKAKGYNVKPYKAGPDFIDPSYHTFITNNPSRNLDSFMMSKETILKNFINSSKGGDIAVIEGVMGLYDSISGIETIGSTAEIARITKSPVILILDATKIARSAAAIVTGFQKFDPEIYIAGVIVNKISTERHGSKIKEAIEHYTKIPVIGIIPENKEIALTQRYLGLVPVAEALTNNLYKISDFVCGHLNIDELLTIAKGAEELPNISILNSEYTFSDSKLKIGVVYDKAFNFYYPENLELLEQHGAKIEILNSIHTKKLPTGINGLYIGGGFPELFAKELEANESFRNSIYDFANDGMPIYAECGGLMFLGNSVINLKDEEFKMVDFFDYKTVMNNRLEALGYVEAIVEKDNLISEAGDIIKGHEFHYSKMVGDWAKFTFAYKLKRGEGIVNGKDGIIAKNILASYTHVHASSFPKMIKKFLIKCKR